MRNFTTIFVPTFLHERFLYEGCFVGHVAQCIEHRRNRASHIQMVRASTIDFRCARNERQRLGTMCGGNIEQGVLNSRGQTDENYS